VNAIKGIESYRLRLRRTAGRHGSPPSPAGDTRRTFRLAPHLTAEAVTASYDAGVLTLRAAGAYAEAEGQRVEITSSVPVQGDVTEAHQG